jgi:hypothetical protein
MREGSLQSGGTCFHFVCSMPGRTMAQAATCQPLTTEPGFNISSVCLRYMMDKMVVKKAFLLIFWFYHVGTIPDLLRHHLFFHCLFYVMFRIKSIVKNTLEKREWMITLTINTKFYALYYVVLYDIFINGVIERDALYAQKHDRFFFTVSPCIFIHKIFFTNTCTFLHNSV